ITALATAVFAFGCLALAWATNFGLLLGAMVVAGAGWLVVVSSLILAAQRGAAEWVRGRALAVSTLTLFGSLAVGALLWGVVANQVGITLALTAAGGGLLVGLGLIPRFRLAAAEALHLERSQMWQDPVVAEALDPEAGPVLVTVEYTLEPAKRPPLPFRIPNSEFRIPVGLQRHRPLRVAGFFPRAPPEPHHGRRHPQVDRPHDPHQQAAELLISHWHEAPHPRRRRVERVQHAV